MTYTEPINKNRAKARALETEYKGLRFRSRLEARWAVAFDALGVKARYEPQGFDLDGERYLPDFYLPRRGVWVEVKPYLQDMDLSKPIALARYTGEPVACVGDIPDEDSNGPHHLLIGYDRTGNFTVSWFAWRATHRDIGGVLEEPHGFARNIGSDNKMPDMWQPNCSPVLVTRVVANAYREARQARFEHGERMYIPRPSYADQEGDV